MIRLNLNKNDTIVIIIIFICYSIFMLYNTRNIFEKFESSANINRCKEFSDETQCSPNKKNVENNMCSTYTSDMCVEPMCIFKNGKCTNKTCYDIKSDVDCNQKINCKWDKNKHKCNRKYNCRWYDINGDGNKKCYENAYLAKKLKNLKSLKNLNLGALGGDSSAAGAAGVAGQTNFDFEETEQNFKIYKFFCNKLKLLNKPNKNDLIFRKFTNDFIYKKKNHINKLNEQIKTLQETMFNKNINKYNINKLRQHDQADKQYSAIIKGIENIKNRDKIKLTLN